MMTRFFFLLLLLGFSSCFQYETQFEGPYTEEAEGDPSELSLPVELVYTAGGQVYLANKFGRDSIVIANTGVVELASINYEHSQVAFKVSNENIKIYQIETEEIVDEIPDSENAIWFDFHANNSTVYYLLDNKLYTHGPAIFSDQPINLRSLSGIFGQVKGVAVMTDGTIIFSMLSSGTLNKRYMLIGNEDEVTRFFEINAAESRMRINEAEDVLWAGDEFDNFLHSWRLPQMTSIDFESQYYIGAPVSGTRGFKVTADDEIYTPEFRYIQSPDGEITSIDF